MKSTHTGFLYFLQRQQAPMSLISSAFSLTRASSGPNRRGFLGFFDAFRCEALAVLLSDFGPDFKVLIGANPEKEVGIGEFEVYLSMDPEMSLVVSVSSEDETALIRL